MWVRDLDLVVENPNTWDNVTDLRRIGKILKRLDIAKRITVVAKAKVPIVKFTSVIGDFHPSLLSKAYADGFSDRQFPGGHLNQPHQRNRRSSNHQHLSSPFPSFTIYHHDRQILPCG